MNISISALRNCISALASPGKDHRIPFRDSHLTRLLQDSLSGDKESLTSLVVTIGEEPSHQLEATLSKIALSRLLSGQSEEHLCETVRSLRFGELAMGAKVRNL